jgi:hypothetical protein
LIGATRGGESSAPDMPVVAGTTTASDRSLAHEVESEVAAEATSSPVADEVADQDPVASSFGPMANPSSPQSQVVAASASIGDDDNITEEPEAVLGHPLLRALRDVSLNEVMGTVRWALTQA